MMQQENLGAQEDFEMVTQSTSTDPKELEFNKIVMCLQQVILEQEFEETQTCFMKKHCEIGSKSSGDIKSIFSQYQFEIGKMLENKMNQHIEGFRLASFAEILQSKRASVDEEIAEIVLSCTNPDSFHTLLKDYQIAGQEEERYKTLTIKTNKIPENKKVKGNSQNIFGSSNTPSFGQPKNTKKQESKVCEKTIEQVFVPETILTVKGLRKV